MAIFYQRCISWLPAPTLGGVPILVIDNCVSSLAQPRASRRYDYLCMMRSPSSKPLSSQGGSHTLQLVKLLACVSRYIIPKQTLLYRPGQKSEWTIGDGFPCICREVEVRDIGKAQRGSDKAFETHGGDFYSFVREVSSKTSDPPLAWPPVDRT